MKLRRLSVTVTLALGASVVLAPGAQADRPTVAATWPDGTYVTCNGDVSHTYLMVGGAPIATDPAALGGTASTTGVDCSAAGEGPGVNPWYPTKEGTFVQGYAGGAATGPVYVIVGGAPMPAAATAVPTSVEQFDNSARPLPGAPDQTVVNGSPVYGMFSSIVRNGHFKSPSGTYYRTDAAGHPVVLSTAVPASTPTLDQVTIDGCVRMNCDPWGDLTVTPVGNGQVRVSGYALDALTSQSLTVHLEGGGHVYDVPANQPAPDVNAGFGVAGNHGFDRVLSMPAGHYDLCSTFVGFAPGPSTPVGCQVVDVPGAKPGQVSRPKVKAKGHGKALVKWKAAASAGSPITAYVVKPSGGKKRLISGTKTSLLLKHLHVGTTLTVKVQALNGIGAGPVSKKSKKVRIR